MQRPRVSISGTGPGGRRSNPAAAGSELGGEFVSGVLGGRGGGGWGGDFGGSCGWDVCDIFLVWTGTVYEREI